MDQNVLVNSGHALLRALDAEGIPPRIAMWVHDRDADTWKLWIVPHQSIKHKPDFYRRVSQIISRDRPAFGGIDASDTEMVPDSHPAMQGLGRIMNVPGISAVAFAGNRFNGFYLPDGIILRVNP